MIINAVTKIPFADPSSAAAHFSRRLSYETDASDVAAALAAGDPGFALIDVRSRGAFEAGHLPSALHFARPFAPDDLAGIPGRLVVVYCWGPGCNGAQKAALELAQLGFSVKEMLGGFEYWVREGHPTQGHDHHLGEAIDDQGLTGLRPGPTRRCGVGVTSVRGWEGWGGARGTGLALAATGRRS